MKDVSLKFLDFISKLKLLDFISKFLALSSTFHCPLLRHVTWLPGLLLWRQVIKKLRSPRLCTWQQWSGCLSRGMQDYISEAWSLLCKVIRKKKQKPALTNSAFFCNVLFWPPLELTAHGALWKTILIQGNKVEITQNELNRKFSLLRFLSFPSAKIVLCGALHHIPPNTLLVGANVRFSYAHGSV